MENILTENVLLTRIVASFIVLIEIFISRTFLVYILGLRLSKFKAVLFFLTCFPLQLLSIWIAPLEWSPYINILITFIFMAIFFQIDFTQRMFILIIPLTFFQISKSLFIFIIALISDIQPLSLVNIPIIRPIIVFPTYFIMFLFLDYLKRFNLNHVFSFEFDLSSKLMINSFSLFIFSSALMNGYVMYISFSHSSIILIIANLLSIALLIALILKILALKAAETQIECEKKSYDFLSNSYDCIRGFKHDFSNIMQSIGGYILNDDLDGLKKYYSSIFKECSELKKISVFNKDVLNSPPVLALIAEKYYKAKELDIEFNIEVFIDLNNLNMDIYEFTRILGIFLDNSIEAASQSAKRIINITISKDFRNHFDSLIIENSCDSEIIDTEKIFEKNFSTKPKNTGLGLWKVKNILTKYDNVSLNTSVRNNFFKHQLKIYY
ncbi:MAG: sensor histidine kinase [Clostridia bacterium]